MFAGEINQLALQRILQGMSTVTLSHVPHVHLLFQSAGGFVGDGVCLHNVFRGFPLPLTVYNTGAVQSIAVIAYLGAHIRQASAHATFMIHRTRRDLQAATASRLKSVTQSLLADDVATEAILRQHIKLTDDHWSHLEHHDLVFGAADAIAIGLATEIGEFAPPSGVKVYNL